MRKPSDRPGRRCHHAALGTQRTVFPLLLSTGTTIATFLIPHKQSRDARVMQLKLDELIRAISAVRTELVQMETLSDDGLNAEP